MSLTSSCWNRLRWPTQLPSAPASGRAHYATRYRAVAPQIAGFALGGSAGVAFEPRTTGLRLLCNPLSGHLLLGPREVPPVGVARSPPSPVRGQVVLLGLRPSRPALAPQIAGFVCIRFSFSVRILLFWPRGVRGGVRSLVSDSASFPGCVLTGAFGLSFCVLSLLSFATTSTSSVPMRHRK